MIDRQIATKRSSPSSPCIKELIADFIGDGLNRQETLKERTALQKSNSIQISQSTQFGLFIHICKKGFQIVTKYKHVFYFIQYFSRKSHTQTTIELNASLKNISYRVSYVAIVAICQRSLKNPSKRQIHVNVYFFKTYMFTTNTKNTRGTVRVSSFCSTHKEGSISSVLAPCWSRLHTVYGRACPSFRGGAPIGPWSRAAGIARKFYSLEKPAR